MLALFVLALPAACGTSDDEGDSVDEEGLRMCCALGALCHRVSAPDDEIEACHQLGHENDPAACRDAYDHCLDVCGEDGSSPEHACL